MLALSFMAGTGFTLSLPDGRSARVLVRSIEWPGLCATVVLEVRCGLYSGRRALHLNQSIEFELSDRSVVSVKPYHIQVRTNFSGIEQPQVKLAIDAPPHVNVGRDNAKGERPSRSGLSPAATGGAR